MARRPSARTNGAAVRAPDAAHLLASDTQVDELVVRNDELIHYPIRAQPALDATFVQAKAAGIDAAPTPATPTAAKRTPSGAGLTPGASPRAAGGDPQHRAVWSWTIPHVYPPAVSTVENDRVLGMLPVFTLPQHTSVPSGRTPQVASSPTLMLRNAPGGALACPDSFRPQHATVSLAPSIQQACPTPTSRTPVAAMAASLQRAVNPSFNGLAASHASTRPAQIASRTRRLVRTFEFPRQGDRGVVSKCKRRR